MKQAKVLTEIEFKRVLAVIAAGKHSERNRIAVLLSHYAGLRVGEIATLQVGDLVLRDGLIADEVHLNPAFTKGGVGRTIFICTKLSKALGKYVDWMSGLPKCLSTPSSPLIQSQKGGAFSANSLCQVFGTIYEKAGFENCSSHSGRRFFISKLAHSGVSAKVIMELAGHRHLTTTQRYIEVSDKMKRAAVEII